MTNERNNLPSSRSAPTWAQPAFPPDTFAGTHVPVQELEYTGVPLTETVYLTIGGGLGSFAWADHLRIFGAQADQVVVLGPDPLPHARFERLCGHSQIPPHERIRSNSDACPDNIWGWPGYAVREFWSSLQQHDFRNAAKVLWQVFNEPTFAETYTPRAGDVYAAIEREADRVGWSRMWRNGWVHAIRKTDDGRYVAAYSQTKPGKGSRDRLIIAQYVHVAVGHPRVRVLPDVQQYRARTGDRRNVVNAYEPHEHIYAHLLDHGGVVLVRGRGIVASRIIQRLHEMRTHNPNIAILHLLRSPLAAGQRYGRLERRAEHHWEFQIFNWPKACWGGEFRAKLEQADDQERDQLLDKWGGTTTARRADWVEIIDRGLREGWYQIRFGDLYRVECAPAGTLLTIIRGQGAIQDATRLCVDFIIDCTGLEPAADRNPLLRDLLTHYRAAQNPKGRLKLANSFEVIGMANGTGRMYASGAPAFGGSFAPVDSFLGLQYAALCSVEALAGLHAPELRPLTSLRSIMQWIAWARGVAP
jgi:pSer/pThr/pTyr-binding forkhead associated (FHA) protein